MPHPVEWTSRANQDLFNIADYIALDSPKAAIRWLSDMQSKDHEISQFPNVGRVVPEFTDPTIRELIKGNYRIIYFVEGSQIWILRVISSFQELTELQ